MTMTPLLSRSCTEQARIRLKTFVLPVVLSAAGLLLGPACTESGKQEKVVVDGSKEALNGEMRHDDEVSGVLFSPDESCIVTYSKDKTARVWDAATGKPLMDPLRHDDAVGGVNFSPDGQLIVTFGGDKVGRDWVRVWDLATGRPLFEQILHQEAIEDAKFSPDGLMILVHSYDEGVAFLHDAANGELLGERFSPPEKIEQATFSSDGRYVVTAGTGVVYLWSVSRSGPMGVPRLLGDDLFWVHLTADGSRILGSNKGEVLSWDFSTEKVNRVDLEMPEVGNEAGALSDKQIREMLVDGMKFNADGTYVCGTTMDGKTVYLWDSASGDLTSEPLQLQYGARTTVFSPDGRFLAVVCGRRDERNFETLEVISKFSGEVLVWNVITGRQVGKSLRHPGVHDACYSPNGKTILTLSDNKMARLWDAKTSDPVGEPMLHSGVVSHGQYNPAGTRIVTTSGNSAYLWDATTGEPLNGSD